MNSIFGLAWRNIWRNKRRTLITSASVFFAVFFAIIMRSFHLGSWDYMISNLIHSSTGYVQVHKAGFWDEKSFEFSMAFDDSLKSRIKGISHVKELVPRVESFVLGSSGEKTKGIVVTGIDFGLEESFSGFSKWMVLGEFPKENKQEVLIAEGLAKYFNLKPGDTLCLIGMGHQGNSAAGNFVLSGILKLPSPELNNLCIYMPLKTAQDFFSLQDNITSLIVDIDDDKYMDQISTNLQAELGNNYEVMTWKELMRELYETFVFDNASGLIILSILYMIVGFGVFGTVFMMVTERLHEFGIMLAVGMKKWTIRKMIALEMTFIVLIGLIAGTLGSVPIVWYYHLNPIKLTGEMAKSIEAYNMEPILPVLWEPDYFYHQAFAVMLLVFIAILIPVYKTGNLNIIKALRK